MADQMLLRIDPELKAKLDRMARAEGKSSSGMVRELIAAYVKERDIGAYIDGLWNRVGDKLKAKGIEPERINQAVKDARRRRP
jgi:Ribbon-helix-helix protein, copG family